MNADELRLDGNAVAGLLAELFGADVTTAVTICAQCGSAGQVGTLAVYTNAPGTVVRCTGCAGVLLRVVRGRGRLWLDLRGIRSLEIEAPEAWTHGTDTWPS
ncbi:MAG TPA: DUF6510 family protein [Dehalococcoidia bacterium]|nr:DUF6510 family protein [Dehalococcoidia bacterium]